MSKFHLISNTTPSPHTRNESFDSTLKLGINQWRAVGVYQHQYVNGSDNDWWPIGGTATLTF